MRPVHVERHLVGVLLGEAARASLVDVVAVGGAVHAEREERGPRAGADGVGAQAAAPGELGERGVSALSFVLRDLVLVPRRDLRLQHGPRVAARSVGRVGL